MSITRNIRSMINRIVLSDTRRGVRFYSEETNENAEDEKKEIDPSKDRTKIIPVELSIRYIQSKAYNQTYGDKPVWHLYRRNHKGGFAPKKTRQMCIRNGVIATGNPCPICRDEYLVLDPRNTKLLEQFISEYTGQILDAFKTGLCQYKHRQLLVAIEQAWDQGYLTYDVPFREYDYALYNN
ncbi:28S ribosomal protein S18b, mitochondrial [Colias croceus]|uniref:28S ribosomal protein S18b, mitochondrial n=1 Tax=Colias crocea TaxID=72248 RepID=UPI001E27B5E8|nr:28S ribosomal protein S18b, mitochondrial [Colias croceus]